jgi:D-glycero-D-manno-heptose 1,7-bisphosphate phosphatase
MNRAIFFDVDGTLTGTMSGEIFKKHSADIAVLPGVKEGIEFFGAQNPPWIFIGISNQGGVGAGHKSIDDAVDEMANTLMLIPQLSAIYFCPDFEGRICHRVTASGDEIIHLADKDFEEGWTYRKPDAGMIHLAANENAIDLKESWMIGDRREDGECAVAARVNFMWADMWRNRFLPGMFEIKNATLQQVAFLENLPAGALGTFK